VAGFEIASGRFPASTRWQPALAQIYQFRHDRATCSRGTARVLLGTIGGALVQPIRQAGAGAELEDACDVVATLPAACWGIRGAASRACRLDRPIIPSLGMRAPDRGDSNPHSVGRWVGRVGARAGCFSSAASSG
jgi:hypothetical protein